MAKRSAGSVNVRADVRRVLVYRMGSLGDTVVALPALHLIAKAFPNAERRMLTNFPVSVKAPAAKAILADNGLIHGYFRYVVGTRSVKELAALWWTLLCWRPEVLVYLGPRRGVAAARRDAQFFRLCGMRWQVGVPVNDEMQNWLLQPETGQFEPESERLVRNISELGDAGIDSPAAWDLRLTAGEDARAAEALKPAGERPVLAVSVGTKVQSKDWGRENWRALLERLGSAFPECALALAGVQEENEASEFAADGWRAGAGDGACVVNLCGALTPRESAAVFARAKLFLGHDSGPMHLAAAVGTPCVAIFAARNIPRVWFPHGDRHRVIYHEVDCMGCGLETCIVQKKKCLTSITIEEVFEAVRQGLGGSSGSSSKLSVLSSQ
jgi:ADP-heptose:LPS heptosyltransferase